MKNIRTYLNTFLCALLAMLGVGCHTQKKAISPTPVIEPDPSEQQIRVKYGIPYPMQVQNQVDSIANNAEDVNDSVVQDATRVICMYGVPTPKELK